MLEHFYDIESLSNVFTLCNYKPEDDEVDVYYISDKKELVSADDFESALTARIHEKNSNFHGKVNIFDLNEEKNARKLSKEFGVSNAYLVNNPKQTGDFPKEFRPICDTDDNYNEDEHPYLFGYNSYNYDLTMLAHLFTIMWGQDHKHFSATRAKYMRFFNDKLFTPEFKNQMPQALITPEDGYQSPEWMIRKNMLMSGRHLDVARLNEKQSKVGLKRLLGMLGYQILESDKLGVGFDRIDTPDEFYDLVAYNVSDVVNLKELMNHSFYRSQFDLKKGLLNTYPELIYKEMGNTYKPDKRPEMVRRDRLTIDSSSAQFATKCLCPYGHLKDIDAVSFMYPAPEIAKEKGIEPVNVLDDAKQWFDESFKNFPEIRAEFQKVYDYYKRIEGHNFNDSDNYINDRQNPLPAEHIRKDKNCMPYYFADGTPSSCFITFSIGGIHGAEYNKTLYEYHHKCWEQSVIDMRYVQSIYPDPLDLRKAKSIEMPNGDVRKYSDFIVSGATIKCMEDTEQDLRAKNFYRKPEDNEPKLFITKNGSQKLDPKYVYTSGVSANHEDFTSYYPNLLRQMRAFWNNGIGVDRYGQLFQQKEDFGKLMKDPSLTDKERDYYANQRGGTKLLLNSASGAGDTNFDSNIKMNNRIISMRIIGQLFTWRIGQAQTLAGAKIVSTNTDGLYSVMEKTLNDKVLASEAKNIGVDIEPEPLFLISKDANNRIEMSDDGYDGKLFSASGGTLACRNDTDPTKSLAHPAIVDWALSEYLIVAAHGYKGMSLSKPFDRETGMNILLNAPNQFDTPHLLRMFQNVLASSTGSVISVIFGEKDDSETPVILQHYNRVFVMNSKFKDKNAMHLRAANIKKITPATIAKRDRDGVRRQQHDMKSLQILKSSGIDTNSIDSLKEATFKKITGIEPEWNMLICNESLFDMPSERQYEILGNLDLEKYLDMVEDSYTNNWMNIVPEE